MLLHFSCKLCLRKEEKSAVHHGAEGGRRQTVCVCLRMRNCASFPLRLSGFINRDTPRLWTIREERYFCEFWLLVHFATGTESKDTKKKIQMRPKNWRLRFNYLAMHYMEIWKNFYSLNSNFGLFTSATYSCISHSLSFYLIVPFFIFRLWRGRLADMFVPSMSRFHRIFAIRKQISGKLFRNS